MDSHSGASGLVKPVPQSSPSSQVFCPAQFRHLLRTADAHFQQELVAFSLFPIQHVSARFIF